MRKISLLLVFKIIYSHINKDYIPLNFVVSVYVLFKKMRFLKFERLVKKQDLLYKVGLILIKDKKKISISIKKLKLKFSINIKKSWVHFRFSSKLYLIIMNLRLKIWLDLLIKSKKKYINLLNY